MKATHKIIIQKGEGAGPQSQKSAMDMAQRYKTPGRRLYTDQKQSLDAYHFVEREIEDFKPGTISTVKGPGGISIQQGELKPDLPPKYKRPEGK